MLVLSRKARQQIHIGDNIIVTVIKVKENSVSIGIDASREVRALRGELLVFAGSEDAGAVRRRRPQ